MKGDGILNECVSIHPASILALSRERTYLKKTTRNQSKITPSPMQRRTQSSSEVGGYSQIKVGKTSREVERTSARKSRSTMLIGKPSRDKCSRGNIRKAKV